jgi:uncharacterized membrane protein
MNKLAKAMAILSTGLLAGAFTYAYFTIVPTFSEVPLKVHLTYRDALMRHNGIYVQTVTGLSIVAPAWWACTLRASAGARSLAISASILSWTAFLVTRFGNVPMNQLIKTWSPDAPPPGYQELLGRWLLFHNVRTVAALASFVCIVIAATALKE